MKTHLTLLVRIMRKGNPRIGSCLHEPMFMILPRLIREDTEPAHRYWVMSMF